MVPNIRKADVGEQGGWILCELDGVAGVVDGALDWLRSEGSAWTCSATSSRADGMADGGRGRSRGTIRRGARAANLRLVEPGRARARGLGLLRRRGLAGEGRGPGPREAAVLGDVAGLDLVHLQCHFGKDTLGWARGGCPG